MMENVLVPPLPHPLAHFDHGLKEEMCNTEPAWNGKFYLEPKLIDKPKLIEIYNTQPPYTRYVLEDVICCFIPSVREALSSYSIFVFNKFLFKEEENLFVVMDFVLSVLPHLTPGGMVVTLLMRFTFKWIGIPLTTIVALSCC